MSIGRSVSLAVVCLGLLAGAGSSQAAYSDNFNAVIAELTTRSTELSSSTSAVERKQGRACTRALFYLSKYTASLGTDIKAARKVARILVKAFPAEFGVAPSGNLQSLLSDAFDNVRSDLESSLSSLQSAINALPDGAAKIKAQRRYEAALAALTYALDFKNLFTSYKALVKGQRIVDRATGTGGGGGGGGGGGSCGTITSSTVTMTVQSSGWSATGVGEYLLSTGFFVVGGTASDGSALGIIVNSGVTGPGTYALSTSSTYTIGSPPTQTFTVTSGSITINGLDTTTWSACGTASFTATDGSTTITVTDLQFSVTNMGHE